MVEDATATLEARDGTPLPVPPDAGRGLARLLANPSIRGYLARHGLEVSRQGDRLRVGVAALRRVLHRLPEDLEGAPPAVLEHPCFSGESHRGLMELVAATPGGSVDGAHILVPVDRRRPRLEVVPEPEEPREILLSMERVGREGAREMLRALDGMLERLDLPPDLLLRSLVPLLDDEDACGPAARVLGRAGAVDAAGDLERALSRTGSVDNRLEILGALIRLGHRALGLRTLRSILIHGSEAARALAIRTLEEIAAPGDTEVLYDMMRLTPRVERLRLASLLYRLGDARAFEVLSRGISTLGPTSPGALTLAALDAVEVAHTRRFIPSLEAYRERETRPWYRARAEATIRRLRRSGTVEATPDQLLQAAERAYFSDRRDEAVAHLTELLTLVPEHARALYLKANCLKEEGRVEEALEASGRALSADPLDWRLHRLRGSLLWDGGRHHDALESYGRALRLHPTDPYTWYYKGYVLYRLQRYEEALPCLDRALSLKGDSPYIYNQKGFCLERLGRHDLAAICYRKSLRLEPGDPFTRECLGQALQATGQLEEALSCFDAVLEAAPNREEALYHRADVLYDLERWSDAEAAYSAYLALCPESYDAWFDRGHCLRFLGRRADAAACFRRAVQLRPECADTRQRLAECLSP